MDKIYTVRPNNNMALLSQLEIKALRKSKDTVLYKLFRDCSLAVLSCEDENDDPEHLLNSYKNYDVEIIQLNSGISLNLINPPEASFANGKLIEGVRDSLFSVLRDILYIHTKIDNNKIDFDTKEETTNSVFKILRNAEILNKNETNLIICWGGHSIKRDEYEYTKRVGYQLGLLDFDIGTGCGLGAMKGPMKGATIAHAKTRKKDARYIGISEPGIIASEAPNPIVNKLVILPDIEKRLEAFVRLGHGIVIFPGGAGTVEEFIYLIGILMNPKNKNMKLPVILTGGEESREYINKIDAFIGKTLGDEAKKYYKICFNEFDVARIMSEDIKEVKKSRIESEEAFYYNWGIEIDRSYQLPFSIDHKTISEIEISHGIPKHELACNLRKIFSVIVAGNIKPEGIKYIRENGPFVINGDNEILKLLDDLLNDFVIHGRMKLPSEKKYEPCYIIKKQALNWELLYFKV